MCRQALRCGVSVKSFRRGTQQKREEKREKTGNKGTGKGRREVVQNARS